MFKLRRGIEMKTVKLILILVLVAAIVIAVMQNTATVETRFLWIHTEAPVILLLIVSSAVGLFLGLLVALFRGKGKEEKK